MILLFQVNCKNGSFIKGTRISKLITDIQCFYFNVWNKSYRYFYVKDLFGQKIVDEIK